MSNLQNLFNRVPVSERETAITWYQEAHDFAVFLAHTYNITTEQAAGVIAVISPRISWERNLVDAMAICTTWFEGGDLLDLPDISAFQTNVVKAWNILKLPGVPTEQLLGKKAPKVRAFYSNILYPKSSTDVTVDSWMVRAYYGDLTHKGAVKNDTERQAITQAIIDLANKYQYRACDMQAVLWCQIRKEGGYGI
jgi:hypothetical protein